jgi:SSS family transporter
LKKSRFGIVDYSCLAAYLLALVLMGFYFSKREKTTEDFFLGGRRIPWWAAGLSLIGTGLSAITYIATPAKAFATNWVYLVMALLLPLGALAHMYIALPFFRRLNVTTAYEYLELRFNIIIRMIGSISFIVLQLGRMGVVLFLPAIALSAATGMNVYFCIIVMGLLCTVYTVLGGIEAVIWTDVIQVIVFYAGAIIMLVIIFFSLDDGITTFLDITQTDQKFHMINWSWDLTTTSLAVMIFACFASILVPMTDQAMIQRWLTTPSEKDSRKAILVGAVVNIPGVVLFFLIGAALYAFFKSQPQELNPVMLNDGIVPWFAAQHLPMGVAGLLIAAIFAASMSSMDSSMNSLATAIVTDFYRRFKDEVREVTCLRLARLLTVLFGIFGTGMALLFATTDIKSLVDLISKYNGLFGGGLAGIFLLGMLTNRSNTLGVIIGFLVSGFAVYYVEGHTSLSFFLYFVVGLFTCMIVGYVVSILTGGARDLPDGMSIHTLKK